MCGELTQKYKNWSYMHKSMCFVLILKEVLILSSQVLRDPELACGLSPIRIQLSRLTSNSEVRMATHAK
jgi:hypothetical protein